MKKLISLLMALFLVTSLTSCKEETKTYADRIYKNAKIYSVLLDGSEVHAEALAIKDGKFMYVGNNQGVNNLIGESTEVIDCEGKSIIPGLVDAHLHIASSATKLGSCDLGVILPTIDETPDSIVTKIQKELKQFAMDHPDDEIIRGLGWDRTWFMGSLQGIVRDFVKEDIDAVISDRPVVLTSSCGHAVMLNSKALELAGINKDTPSQGGLIVKDENGEPTGYIKEPTCYGPIIHNIPGYDFSRQEHHDYMSETLNMFTEMGYTLLCDAQQNTLAYEVLSQMAKDNELNARISGVFNINDETREEDLKNAIENRTKFNVDDMFNVDTIKFFVDGTFSMIEPYLESAVSLGKTPGTREPLLWDEDHLKESMVAANKEGFNIHSHAMGSYAINKVVDCYIEAQNQYPSETIRNIIAHCTFVSDEDRVRMGENNIIASNQPGWFSDHTVIEPVYVTCWGEEVVEETYPCKSLIDNGVINAFGSDYAVNIPYGLAGIQVALTRKAVHKDATYEKYKDLIPTRKEECISLKEALQAHTINGAYQAHLEDITGSIEVGKSAELVVLDRDIESTPIDQIENIKVLETVFKGKTVYKYDDSEVAVSEKTFEELFDVSSNGVYADLGNYMILLDEATSGDYQKALNFSKTNPLQSSPCTSIGKRNNKGEVIIGRNLDMPPSLCPLYVFRTSFGKYKTLQFRFISEDYYTYEEFKDFGYKDSDFINYVYFCCTDAMNEKGLYIEANVREANKGFQSSSTNPGKEELRYSMVAAKVAQNCATVKEAIDYLKNEVNYVSKEYAGLTITTDYGFFIGDATGEYGVIEFANNEIYYLPYQNGQANFYLNPRYSPVDMNGSGYGRLERALDGLQNAETKEEIYDQIGKAMWRDEALYAHNAYIDSDGKTHFVDDNGNETIDWRSDIYFDTLLYIYPEKEEELMSILDDKPMSWLMDEANAPIVFKYYQNVFIDAGVRDNILKYYEGDELPARSDPNTYMTGLRIGVNCKQKSFIITVFEKDELTFSFRF